ncbi:type II and III secretion system protein family protein [Mesorhizobium sp. M2D.F.Ca.ET.185.01.1.1]|uniref:type II and III secretion system protein family protein n=1 Tax=unclassified Mesorhizobium TaxID=325217 RepID=UPI000FCBEF59|nr:MULTISPECIES: type II and III secretion system protein family protein [unclassified Mesorhizobium]TGP74407.1 type II and III secretion system protein family protein [bacterium M00.F.Ca.ET.227.01.1.1]TGP85093.1 type II and III secretion system protein family protein [bacterium M00.F.Ca.ET.221.01.1.1]TGP89176.1 type II and III secretion system protein family protein [bacterium M00.F.Ca.ET.222.01.1.1]TGU12751.1 type II and III secretion system protein family protein [bacterium M00.F.Ca.ET.163.0
MRILRGSLAAAALAWSCILLQLSPAAHAADRFIDVSSPSLHRVFIPVSQSVTLQVNATLGDIVVGDEKIADAQPMTDKTLYVIGKSVGTTTVNLFSDDKRSLGAIQIEVGQDVSDMAVAIRQVAPKARIEIGSINGKIRLSGHVKDAATLASIVEVTQQYGPDAIINAVTIDDSEQVNLSVRILEAKRNADRDLGVSFRSTNSRGTTRTGTGVAAVDKDGIVLGPGDLLSGLLSNASPFGALITRVIDSNVKVDLIIEALEQKGVVRLLAEPNLTTVSGETASFNAGGEVPIRSVNAQGEVEIQFKQFGVNLNFTPVVLDDGKIHIKLAPEVSDLTGFTPAGDPIFTNRKLATVVDLRDGQSFAVGGLLSSKNTRLQDQVPWLGQVPIIGALFHNSSTQKEETELVVIVTPYLVRPVKPGEQLATPFDKTRPANDPELMLLGQLEVSKDMIRKYELGDGVTGPYGHMLDVKSKDKLVYVKK